MQWGELCAGGRGAGNIWIFIFIFIPDLSLHLSQPGMSLVCGSPIFLLKNQNELVLSLLDLLDIKTTFESPQ